MVAQLSSCYIPLPLTCWWLPRCPAAVAQWLSIGPGPVVRLVQVRGSNPHALLNKYFLYSILQYITVYYSILQYITVDKWVLVFLYFSDQVSTVSVSKRGRFITNYSKSNMKNTFLCPSLTTDFGVHLWLSLWLSVWCPSLTIPLTIRLVPIFDYPF